MSATLQTSQQLRSVFTAPGTQWLAPVLLSGQTVCSYAQSSAARRNVAQVMNQLADDDYLVYLREYYEAGENRFGQHWNYADLLTFLQATCELVQPRTYLEIGVRRGRSMAIVANACPSCQIVGFDMWMENYAGMPNPGPAFVESELQQCGYRGNVELISGDSHETVPAYFAANGHVEFDVINVDGDHSDEGARADLLTVLPHLAIGGVILLDDIVHPQHRYLEEVWEDILGRDDRYSCAKFKDLGYGVAVAVRKW